MILLVGSQKGGCGKSTTAINICSELVKQKYDVVLVDSDRQSTSANWIMDRLNNNNLPKIHCVQKYDNIRETLIDLNNRYQYVIVDVTGRDSRELRTGMITADILLVPLRPSQPDLDTLPKLQEIIKEAKDFNKNLTVYALLTMAPTNPIINESEEAKEYLKDYPDIRLLKTIIRDRKVYRDSISEGMGVVEMNNNKATQEIKSLVKEVF